MEKPNFLPDSPSFVDLCTLHQHAMRYYRLWIYACNTVLAVATLVFTFFAVSVLVDPRITLLSGVELYQPTFIYAYIALILQCGVLQTIGCLGALRLNQRLLNTYWTLLLLLMLGDIVVGLVWAIRLDRIKSSLRPGLRTRLSLHYGLDPHFTQVWDWVQTHDICCGIESPNDFYFNESMGDMYEGQNVVSGGSGDNMGALPTSPFVLPPQIHRLPSTCCTFSKKDSLSPGDLAKLQGNSDGQPSVYLPYFARHHHSSSGGPGSRDYISSEINKRHSHQHPSLKPTIKRSPRAPPATDSASVAAFLRNKPRILPPTSTILPKTERIQNHSSKGGSRWRARTAPPIPHLPHHNNQLPHHPILPSSVDPEMMRSDDEVQNFCELPPELVALNPQSSSTQFESEGHHHDEKLNFGATISSTSSSPATTGRGSGTSTEIPITKDKGHDPGYSQLLLHHYYIHQHRHGCAEKIVAWVDHVTDVLFVLGFCIIVFLKGCFLAILRYEIKEMIQKIRLLNGDETVRSAAMNELIGLTSIYNATSQEELEEVTALELEPMSPVTPPESKVKKFQNQSSIRQHHNACGAPGGPIGNSTTAAATAAGDTPGGAEKPAKKGYPPFGNYLNSNNMMYRLQRQMSQQAQQDDEEDAESCSALLQLTQRRSQSGSAASGSGSSGGEKRNSTSSRRVNSVAIPIPRNGNNNSMAMTTTALVGATSVTGAAPLTSAAAASVLS